MFMSTESLRSLLNDWFNIFVSLARIVQDRDIESRPSSHISGSPQLQIRTVMDPEPCSDSAHSGGCTAPQLALKIDQNGSTFESKIELKREAELNQGNTISGILQGQIQQGGSTFSGVITAEPQSKVEQGNTINGRVNATPNHRVQ
ncbi:hypothetical protein GGR58DRAFT_494815 [Xylaria digitata]|nr:hypothetical protein GGR58DRAFT_494815 [Xylaria digitata]